MEKIKLLVNHHRYKGYDAIPSTTPLLINENEPKMIIKRDESVRHKYKCVCKMSNGGTFVIKNLKKNIDIANFSHDSRLLSRYFIEKSNISYIRSNEHKVVDQIIEYELVITLNDGEIIKACFNADAAVETYEFLRRCFRSWNTKIYS